MTAPSSRGAEPALLLTRLEEWRSARAADRPAGASDPAEALADLDATRIAHSLAMLDATDRITTLEQQVTRRTRRLRRAARARTLAFCAVAAAATVAHHALTPPPGFRAEATITLLSDTPGQLPSAEAVATHLDHLDEVRAWARPGGLVLIWAEGPTAAGAHVRREAATEAASDLLARIDAAPHLAEIAALDAALADKAGAFQPLPATDLLQQKAAAEARLAALSDRILRVGDAEQSPVAAGPTLTQKLLLALSVALIAAQLVTRLVAHDPDSA